MVVNETFGFFHHGHGLAPEIIGRGVRQPRRLNIELAELATCHAPLARSWLEV